MKKNGLIKALNFMGGILVIALSVTTYHLFKENKKLRVFYETTDPQYEDLQKLKTIRNFVDLQFNYNSDNFKKNQNLAKNYVEPKLSSMLHQELNSIYTNVLKDQVQQVAELMSIRPELESTKTYQLILKITNTSKTDQLIIYNKIKIRIEKTYRSFENPEGYWITELEQSILTETPITELSMVIEPNRMSILAVPCSVNQIENQNPQFEIKLTKGMTSEIQIRNQDKNATETDLEIFCDRTQFNIKISNKIQNGNVRKETDEEHPTQNSLVKSGSDKTVLRNIEEDPNVHGLRVEYFKSILLSQGVQLNRVKKQNPVAHELKNDLGIIIESAD